jgi:hypothetical protein
MNLKTLLLLPVLLCFASCATVFNKKEYTVNLTGTKENMKVTVNDSTYSLPAAVKVKRSKHDLPITVISDSGTKQAVIEPGMSPTFFYANVWLMEFSPLLYAGDLFSQKRFYYGRDLTLDDTTSVYKPSVFTPYKEYFGKKYYGEKGQWNIIVGMPYGNMFYMQPRNLGTKKGGGFFGFEVGAEYFYKPRKFLKFTTAVAIDFLAPVPAPVDYEGDHETMRSRSFTLSDNYIVARSTLSYGINYSIYSWKRVSPDYGEDPLAPRPSKKDSHAFGPSLGLHHQFLDFFSFGATYNPTVYSVFPTGQWQYQHTISIELIFRIPLNREFTPDLHLFD